MELKIYPDPVLAQKCADVEIGDVQHVLVCLGDTMDADPVGSVQG